MNGPAKASSSEAHRPKPVNTEYCASIQVPGASHANTLSKTPIKTWRQFARSVRSKGDKLLAQLDNFPDAVLVAGCQRSGTTMLARTLSRSDGMINYWTNKDDELDAALILSGAVDYRIQGRHCFQTTYLNERYKEYFEHADYRLIWAIRNPYSVIYSMLNNWGRFAFNELFYSCGAILLERRQRRLTNLGGQFGISRLTRACLSYTAKVAQIFELRPGIGHNKVRVIDYDVLVNDPARTLPRVYELVGVPYKRDYAASISTTSVKRADALSQRQRRRISELCGPTYEAALTLRDFS